MNMSLIIALMEMFGPLRKSDGTTEVRVARSALNYHEKYSTLEIIPDGDYYILRYITKEA